MCVDSSLRETYREGEIDSTPEDGGERVRPDGRKQRTVSQIIVKDRGKKSAYYWRLGGNDVKTFEDPAGITLCK